MTKYVLVGGYPRKAVDGGKAFFNELIKGFNNKPVKILDCLFARPTETWNHVFNEDKDFFLKYLSEGSFEIHLADVDKFTEQVKWADAIFIKGGNTEELLKLLTKNDEWLNYLNNKTLAGTSAGAEVIAKYYYNLETLKFSDGLGLLPIKVLVHWNSDYNAPNIDWNKSLQGLKDYKDKELPVYLLAEGEFKVINSTEF